MKPINFKQIIKKIPLKALKILKAFMIIGLIFVILLPYYEIFLNAINYSGFARYVNAYWVPTRISFASLRSTFKETIIHNSMLNSLLISLIVSIIQTFTCALFGFAFARLKFKGSNIIFWIIMFSIVFPNETLHIARLLQLANDKPFGLRLIGNRYTLFALTLFGQGIRAPLFIYIFRQYFRAIDKDIEDASLIDGCGIVKSFFKVMLPNAKGGVITTFLMTFVWMYNDYYYSSLLSFSVNGINLVSTRLLSGRYRPPYQQLGFCVRAALLRSRRFEDKLSDEA